MIEPGSCVVAWTPRGYLTAVVVGYDDEGYWVATPSYGFSEPFLRPVEDVHPFQTLSEVVADFAGELEAVTTVDDLFGGDSS